MNRVPRLYLVLIAVFLVAALATAAYLRHRAIETEKAVAACDTPPPPSKPATPPPNLPGFEPAGSCAPGEAPKPATK